MLSAPGLRPGLELQNLLVNGAAAPELTVGQEKVDVVLLPLTSTGTDETEAGKGCRCSL